MDPSVDISPCEFFLAPYKYDGERARLADHRLTPYSSPSTSPLRYVTRTASDRARQHSLRDLPRLLHHAPASPPAPTTLACASATQQRDPSRPRSRSSRVGPRFGDGELEGKEKERHPRRFLRRPNPLAAGVAQSGAEPAHLCRRRRRRIGRRGRS